MKIQDKTFSLFLCIALIVCALCSACAFSLKVHAETISDISGKIYQFQPAKASADLADYNYTSSELSAIGAVAEGDKYVYTLVAPFTDSAGTSFLGFKIRFVSADVLNAYYRYDSVSAYNNSDEFQFLTAEWLASNSGWFNYSLPSGLALKNNCVTFVKGQSGIEPFGYGFLSNFGSVVGNIGTGLGLSSWRYSSVYTGEIFSGGSVVCIYSNSEGAYSRVAGAISFSPIDGASVGSHILNVGDYIYFTSTAAYETLIPYIKSCFTLLNYPSFSIDSPITTPVPVTFLNIPFPTVNNYLLSFSDGSVMRFNSSSFIPSDYSNEPYLESFSKNLISFTGSSRTNAILLFKPYGMEITNDLVYGASDVPDYIPPAGGGGNGSGGGGGVWNPSEPPVLPDNPTIIDWIQYIFEYIVYLISVPVSYIGYLVGQVGAFVEPLGHLFDWLPEPVSAVIVGSIIVLLIVAFARALL